ncbi:putative aldolase [Ilumatobacter coccineus YM16-304]|uniref:Putative aldolase n=2 Tax=Ilumatobacter coccineus TaxID=467094 RepID=A0A6C7E654_ILUCY|nr:putative aldolase [Ilumatobacter coccineus YM16-304]
MVGADYHRDMANTYDETMAELEKQATAVEQDFEAERLKRKQRLAAGLRTMGRLHLAEGVAGHVTVRDPEFPDRFWVNPFGHNFKLMKVSDLICVDHAGDVVVGDRPVNAAAFAIHSRLHAARPDVMAAAHSHSMYGRTFSTLGKPLKMISQDATMFYNDVALCNDGSGAVVLDTAVGDLMAKALGDKKALIHQNHGLITTGGSVDAAVWWFIALERLCQSQLLAESAGDPIEIPEAYCEDGYKAQGHDLAGWFQFQPFWDELVAREPEFLD